MPQCPCLDIPILPCVSWSIVQKELFHDRVKQKTTGHVPIQISAESLLIHPDSGTAITVLLLSRIGLIPILESTNSQVHWGHPGGKPNMVFNDFLIWLVVFRHPSEKWWRSVGIFYLESHNPFHGSLNHQPVMVNKPLIQPTLLGFSTTNDWCRSVPWDFQHQL